MTDAFLAYARKDLKSATEIKDFLEQEGLSVWQDIQIAPGELWRDVILQHLERAKTVIVLWSSSSVNSEWVRAEAQIAADRNKLIPVLIEQVDLPLGFSHYQYLDFTDKKNISASLERLLRAIAQISKFDRRSIEPRPDTPGARVVVPAGRPYKKLPAASSTKVFLAHASADKPRLKPIIIALIEQGFKLWIDKPQAIGLLPRYEEKIALDRIHFGNDWKEDIRKAIKKAHVVLACWSQDAVKGRREQFHYEVYQGMMQKKLNQCRIDTVEFDEIGMPYTFDHIADLLELAEGAYHPEMDYLMQDMVHRKLGLFPWRFSAWDG